MEEIKKPHNLVLFPDRRLFRACVTVSKFNTELKELEAKMLETMQYYQGVGIAANQLDIPGIRMFLMIDEEHKKILTVVNPQVVEEGRWISGPEGCLSLPGIVGMVNRKETIRITFNDTDGNLYDRTFTGLSARICGHELGHLNGETIWARLDEATKKKNHNHIGMLCGRLYPNLPRELKRIVKREFGTAHASHS